MLTALAPLYLAAFAVGRSALEMTLFSRGNRFSYYTALHHLSWYTSLMLAIILTAHLVLRRPVERLLWLMYGITVTALPLAWAVLSGRPLALDYLKGPWREIVLHVVTFCFTYERNWPLVAELVLIFLAMLGLGWALTRSWGRALLLAASVHLVMALIGLAWFSSDPESAAVVTVSSRLIRGQALQAACWVGILSALALVLLWRGGAFHRGRRSWAIAAIVAGEAWIVWALAVLLTGWMPHTFDALITGLPVATAAFLTVRILRSDRSIVSWPALAAIGGVLAIQLLVLAPVALHQEHRLLRPRRIEMVNPRRHRRPPPAHQRAVPPTRSAIPTAVPEAGP